MWHIKKITTNVITNEVILFSRIKMSVCDGMEEKRREVKKKTRICWDIENFIAVVDLTGKMLIRFNALGDCEMSSTWRSCRFVLIGKNEVERKVFYIYKCRIYVATQFSMLCWSWWQSFQESVIVITLLSCWKLLLFELTMWKFSEGLIKAINFCFDSRYVNKYPVNNKLLLT